MRVTCNTNDMDMSIIIFINFHNSSKFAVYKLVILSIAQADQVEYFARIFFPINCGLAAHLNIITHLNIRIEEKGKESKTDLFSRTFKRLQIRK